MISKRIIAPLIVMVLISGIGGVLAAKRTTERRAQNNINAAVVEQESHTTVTSSASETTGMGRYAMYDAAKTSDSQYSTTVLFFYASWCPECRDFKKAITSSQIKSGTQILEVNYDSATDLKKQYGVTLQSTFVKVDDSGKQLSKWVGYGKDKSLQTILSNL